jgi:prevent-host-death family protein
MLSVGMARGETRRQMLSLRVDGAEWFLLAGDSALPLAELLGYDDGQYSVDAAPGVAQLRVDWVASRPARARDASMTAWRSTSPRATVPHMDSIGVRQLQQNAAATVERVRLGESIEVTVRGRVVAKLVPVGGTLLDQLEASGRLKRGKGDVLDLGPPLKPRRGVELPSVALARMRANER